VIGLSQRSLPDITQPSQETGIHPCPLRDPNHQSQQASGSRPICNIKFSAFFAGHLQLLYQMPYSEGLNDIAGNYRVEEAVNINVEYARGLFFPHYDKG
jgi:hypothetical protein